MLLLLLDAAIVAATVVAAAIASARVTMAVLFDVLCYELSS